MRTDRTAVLPRRNFPPLAVAIGILLAAMFPAVAAAQSGTAGAISGRIFNPARGEYIRNAQIRIPATGQSVTSEDDGSYKISPVSPGPVNVVVNYTGYQPVTATIEVVAGGTATRDFELVSSLQRGADGSVVKLDAFTVSSEREGNAKAIMEQRNSMNITNSVASDVFGDVAEGNVGEFLKHLPGVDLFLVQGEVVNVQLRGLGPEYNAVTIDGVTLASADANKGAAGDARAFSFEQASLSSLDSIEVSKTISADVDANAPAGTINLKSKRAFSRAGRRIAFQANLTAFVDDFHLKNSYGPDDERHYKLRPGASFEYSESFFERRLGVVLSVSDSNMYSENARTINTYNFTPTAADPRPAVPTQVAFLHAPRINRRSTVTLTTDFKATQNLILSLGLISNYSYLYNIQRSMTFNAGARTAVTGTDPLVSFTSATNGTVTSNPTSVSKRGQAYTVLPKFEYKLGNVLIEGRFAGSDSKSWYDPYNREGSARNAGGPVQSGVRFTAERSSLISGDWKINQIAGPDFSLGNGYTNPVFLINDGRYGRTQVYSADLTAIWKTNRVLPVTWKTGTKMKREIRDFRDESNANRYTYVGPGAGTGAWAGINSPFQFDVEGPKAGIASSSGGMIFVPNLLAIGRLFREHPEYFTHTLTADNYYTSYIGNTRHFQEDITSGFFMGTANIGKQVIFRAGIRTEKTETDALETDPLPGSEVRAAGFPVSASGRATTIPGLDYQYFSNPKINRRASYDHFFPSASVKYKFTRNLDLHLGYSSTIRRPTIRDLAGVWSINEDAFAVAAPNPKLKPETSDNYSARLAYYFEPVGILAFNLFQNTVKGLHRTNIEMTAAEYGNTLPELADYTFITTDSVDEQVQIRGMELEYSQSLSFLPRPFKGLNVRASYTRNYASVVIPNTMAPHGVYAGLNYSFSRFNFNTSMNWRDDVPTNLVGTGYRRHRATIDIGGSVKLTRRFSVFFAGRNIRSEPVITMIKIRDNPAMAGNPYEITGAIWNFGVKGVW